MKTLLFSLAALLLIGFTSCDKDDCTEYQTVTVNGNYINTVDPASGFHNVTMPDGQVVQIPKKYKVSGSDNVIGTVDASQSVLEVLSTTFNLKSNAFEHDMVITLVGSSGDKMIYKGNGQVYGDWTGISWLHYDGGTGKFEGVTGWMNATSVFEPATGTNTVAGTGEATYKK